MKDTHKNIAPLIPFQKSQSAFLIENLDSLILSPDKPYHVEKWDFSTSHSVGVRNSLKVSFKATPAEYVREIQDTLYQFYHNSEGTLPPSVSRIDTLKRGLQNIAHCLGSTSWRDLDDPIKLKSFLRRLKKYQHGKPTIQHMHQAMNRLTQLGIVTNYIDSDLLFKCAAIKARKQHVAIPPRMFQGMLKHSLQVIEKYHEHRHEISRVMEEAYDLQKRIQNGEKIIGYGRGSGRKQLVMGSEAVQLRVTRTIKKISHNIPDFEVSLDAAAMNEILVSCIIVVLAFSGARIGEVLSFNKDSVKPIIVNGKSIVVLQGETTKGNDGRPKTETWQSHPIVETALELAFDMMESIRAIYMEKVKYKYESGEVTEEAMEHMRKQLTSAFLIPDVCHQKSDGYVFNARGPLLKNFMRKWFEFEANQDDVDEFDRLNPSREGELKVGGTYNKLVTHDLRRTFAVFFVRYGFGTASGIKFQYKHANLNMSDYYANNAILAKLNDVLLDHELLNEIKEAEIELGIDLFDDAYNGSKYLSGAQGEAIKKQRLKKLEEGSSIVMTREEIEEHIRSGDFSIIQLPSGAYCTNPSCDRVCGNQLFRAEIKECTHKIVTDRGAKQLAKQRQRLIAKFQAINTGDKIKSSILAGLKQKIQVDEITLKEHQIEFTAFKDEIIVLEQVS